MHTAHGRLVTEAGSLHVAGKYSTSELPLPQAREVLKRLEEFEIDPMGSMVMRLPEKNSRGVLGSSEDPSRTGEQEFASGPLSGCAEGLEGRRTLNSWETQQNLIAVRQAGQETGV